MFIPNKLIFYQPKITIIFVDKNLVVDKYGQIDEWASVIKNQEEGYKKEMERKRIGKFHLSPKFQFSLTIFPFRKT